MSNDLFIMHYGVGHDKGGHSGRYPWGSGERPGTARRQYKKIMKRNRKTERSIKNDLWDYAIPIISRQTGKTTTYAFAAKKNRIMFHDSVEKLYKTNPEFRKKIKEAKKELIERNKESIETTESYIKQFSDITPNRKNVDKATKWITKNKVNNITVSQNDIDFATSVLFDDVATKKRTGSIITTIGIAYAAYKMYRLAVTAIDMA